MEEVDAADVPVEEQQSDIILADAPQEAQPEAQPEPQPEATPAEEPAPAPAPVEEPAPEAQAAPAEQLSPFELMLERIKALEAVAHIGHNFTLDDSAVEQIAARVLAHINESIRAHLR